MPGKRSDLIAFGTLSITIEAKGLFALASGSGGVVVVALVDADSVQLDVAVVDKVFTFLTKNRVTYFGLDFLHASERSIETCLGPVDSCWTVVVNTVGTGFPFSPFVMCSLTVDSICRQPSTGMLVTSGIVGLWGDFP